MGPAVCPGTGATFALAPQADERLVAGVDETYVRVKGKWVFLYRVVDPSGAQIDFLLVDRR